MYQFYIARWNLLLIVERMSSRRDLIKLPLVTVRVRRYARGVGLTVP